MVPAKGSTGAYGGERSSYSLLAAVCIVACCLLGFNWMAGSRDRPELERAGTLTPLAYGSLYEEGGARGTSGAAGTDSLVAPVVGGGICLLARRLCPLPMVTLPFKGTVATGRAVLLGMVLDMSGSGGDAPVGCASAGRR